MLHHLVDWVVYALHQLVDRNVLFIRCINWLTRTSCLYATSVGWPECLVYALHQLVDWNILFILHIDWVTGTSCLCTTSIGHLECLVNIVLTHTGRVCSTYHSVMTSSSWRTGRFQREVTTTAWWCRTESTPPSCASTTRSTRRNWQRRRSLTVIFQPYSFLLTHDPFETVVLNHTA